MDFIISKYLDTSGEEVPGRQVKSQNYTILPRRIYFFKIPKPSDKQNAVNI